ncbi:MAG: toll/interleukin-1 receptor domain-containing protein [Gemmatimonadales bacterium]|nr:toll/interleukin-1 receptor domain-containing protein [Gemmatimonadales bacterium]
MYSVFVSYAQPQLDWATQLRKDLSNPAILVYVAEHDLTPGDSLSSEIIRQIRVCDLFILLWSEDAQLSHYVGKEVFLAKSEGKLIVPVLLAKAPSLPRELGDIKYLDIANDPARHREWLHSHVTARAKSKKVSEVLTLGMLCFLAWLSLKGSE